MAIFADLFYFFLAQLYMPILLYQAVVLGKNRTGWGQRLGRVPRFDPAQPRIWIHAVSMGEVNATPKLVEAIEARLPGWQIVVSTTTDTGFARAVHWYGRERVFRYPLDFSPCVHMALNRVRPRLIILLELEVWPNLVRSASARGIPVTVANGRLTERSAHRFGFIRPLIRPIFEKLAWVGAQDEAIAARFAVLGVPRERIETTSSLKWDTALVADRVEGAEELAAALGLGQDGPPIWVCGSTGPGEEEILLEVYRSFIEAGRVCRLIIVPRKPERFEEVARLIAARGFSCIRRSDADKGVDGSGPAVLARNSGGPAADGALVERVPTADSTVAALPAVILGDTIGELRKFYNLADLVFVGRSLASMGGSDPIEVAALGKPMLAGPHMTNFAGPAAAFAEAGALVTLANGRELAEQLVDWLDHPEAWRQRGRRAREVVLAHLGCTERPAAKIVELAIAGPATASSGLA